MRSNAQGNIDRFDHIKKIYLSITTVITTRVYITANIGTGTSFHKFTLGFQAQLN
jgi:hypothetical protein